MYIRRVCLGNGCDKRTFHLRSCERLGPRHNHPFLRILRYAGESWRGISGEASPHEMALPPKPLRRSHFYSSCEDTANTILNDAFTKTIIDSRQDSGLRASWFGRELMFSYV